MSHPSAVPGFVAIATVAVLLAGCAAGPSEEKLNPEESPLSEYFNAFYGQGDDEEEAARMQMEVEELVAACMADEGFDYVPVDQSQYMGVEYDYEERNTEEWVAANGYGMNQTPEQIAEQEEQYEEFVDPNQKYVESLSPGEQTAYYDTLHGVPPTEEEMNEDGSYEYNWEDAGCYGSAQHEVNGEDPFSQEDHQELFDDLNKMWEKMQDDPAVVKLDKDWAACMADAGYSDMKKKQDAMDLVMNAQNAAYEEAMANGEDPEQYMGPSEEQVAEMRDTEIEIALADFRCSEEVNYTDAMLEIQFEAEREFIKEHKAELDAIVAEVEKGE